MESEESFPRAGTVYFRRTWLPVHGRLGVFEITPGFEAPIRLTRPAGEEVFSYPPSSLRVTLSSRRTFRIQHGKESWWIRGTSLISRKRAERIRRRIGRDDVTYVLPKLDGLDDELYAELMKNPNAVQYVWCGVWYFALCDAGVHTDRRLRRNG